MILNYDEASAYATAIAQYMMLVAMGTMIFVWAWRNLVVYLKWGVEPNSDEQIELLEGIHEELQSLNSNIEAPSDPHELEIVA